MNSIIIDLDNTITIDSVGDDYPNKLSNPNIIRAIDNAHHLGFQCKIFSSRNMRTFKDDLEKIEAHTRPIAEDWLQSNEVNYHELILGKPWCGVEGWYIDDKNLSLEEFVFKFSGPYWNKSVSVVIPFYDEQENIINCHKEQKKIERLLNISEFIYINNGSSDKTSLYLHDLSKEDKKIKVLDLDLNLGYGGGIKEGLKLNNSDFILLNHADQQFDSYSFFLNNLYKLESLHEATNILPIRFNRGKLDRISSSILRSLLSILTFRKIIDFNGQPKLFQLDKSKDLNELPNNFCLDLSLYFLMDGNYLSLPIIERERIKGHSHWKGSFLKRMTIFIQYLIFAIFKK